jgi:hypothetical protein
VPGAVRPGVRPAAVPDEADDAGRLLPHPLRPAHRARDLGVHRRFLPRLGGGAGDGARWRPPRSCR